MQPVYLNTDEETLSAPTYGPEQSTTLEGLKAAWDQGGEGNSMVQVGRMLQIQSAVWKKESTVLGVDLIKHAKGLGITDLDTKPYDKFTEDQASAIIDRAIERKRQQEVIDSAPQGVFQSVARFIATAIPQIVDPVNLIPIVGEETKIAQMAKTGANMLERMAGRVAVGAIEGTVGNALMEPIVAMDKRATEQNYSGMEAVQNIAMGAPFGAAMHLGIGSVKDVARHWFPDREVAPTTPAPANEKAGIHEAGAIIGDTNPDGTKWAVVEHSSIQAEPTARGVEMAKAFQPSLVLASEDGRFESGAPVIHESGEVVSGNSRLHAIGTQDAPDYRAEMQAHLPQIGIDPREVDGMEKPVLVRVAEKDAQAAPEQMHSTDPAVQKRFEEARQVADGERPPATLEEAKLASFLDQNDRRPAVVAEAARKMESGASLEQATAGPTTAAARLESMPPEQKLTMDHAALAQAVNSGEINVQPIEDLATGKISQAEATARLTEKKAPAPEDPAARTLKERAKARDRAREANPVESLKKEAADLEAKLKRPKAEDVAAHSERLPGTTEPAAPTHVDLVRAAGGDHLAALEKDGTVSLVGTAKEAGLTGEDARAVNAIAKDGKAVYIAENLARYAQEEKIPLADVVRGITLHEVGVHIGLPAMLGDKGFASLLDDVRTTLADVHALDPDDPIRKAWEAVPEKNGGRTPEERERIRHEEFLGYLVEQNPDAGPKTLAGRIIQAVRTWARQHLGKMKLTTEDVVSLAKAAIGSRSEMVERTGEALRSERLPAKLSIDGVERHTMDSIGKPLARDTEGIRNFWKWFGDSKVVDAEGKPLDIGGIYVNSDSQILPDAINGKRYAQFYDIAYKEGQAHKSSGLPLSMNHPDNAEFLSPDLMDYHVAQGADRYTWDALRSGYRDGHNGNPRGYTSAKAVVAKRIGEVPESGVSINFREQKAEPGLSVLGVYENGEYVPQNNSTFEMFNNGPKRNVMGYKSENWIGSDGENVLLRPVDLGLDGTRIKSATGNRGTFDPANPDIRFSRREPVEPIPDAQTVEQKIERAQSVADAFQMAARAFPDAADMVAYIVDEGKLSKTEAQSVADALQREVRKRTLSGLNENSVDEVSQVAKELGDQELFDAWREKRNTLLNQAARERIKATNANAVKGLEGSSKIAEIEGIKASLAGTKYINIEGGRKSLERSMIDRMGQAHTDLIAALEREGLREKFVNDEMEEDIAKARWALSTEDQKGLEGLRPDAVKIARIMEDLQESGRIAKNERGAWIGKAEGYMFRRSWDRYAFSPDKRAKFDEIFGKQNWEKVFSDGREDTPEARQAWLDGVWHSLSTGEHERASDEDLRPMSGPRNIAKKMSQHRTIHFQDALAELGAIREFGASQTLRNAFIGELAKTSRDIALLDHLGPNPEANLQKVIEEIRSSIPPDRRQKFEDHQASVMDLFHTLDGTNNIAENKSLATIGRRWRAYMSMNLLTGALFSQFSDLATGGIALRRRVGGAGKNPFSVLTYQARQIAGLMQGRKSTKKQAILREVGFVYDHLLAGMHDAIGLRDLGRAFGQGPSDEAGRGFDQSKLMKLFFKVNGMQWWVDSSKSTSLLMAMHDMDGLSAKAYEGLPRQTQLWLGSHDIGPLEWETIRKGGRKAADGSRYLTPEGVRSLPDAIADEAERERVASLYQGAIRELGEKANIEPGARVKSAVNIGTRPGTVIGEAVRAGMQFKGFSFAYLQDVLGEEVYGQGYNTLGQMLRKGKGDMVGIAYLVAMSTIYGYASMYCKDLIKGKKPRDPESPKTAMAAMLQGGGAGLYGDFLFGEKSRFGSSALESALGPTYGFAKGLIDIKENARPAIGETMPLDKRARRVGVGVLDMTTRYTPFLNLFYVRPVMDFLIFNQAKDALAPGYFRRRQAQIKRDNDQEVQPWFGKSLGGN